MTASTDIVKFIDRTLLDMTTRPALWGPLPGVEQQVLRLLEVRLLLTDSDAGADDTAEVAQDFWRQLDIDFPGQPVSLRTRVKGDPELFSRWLGEFCQRQRDRQDARTTSRSLLRPLVHAPAHRPKPWSGPQQVIDRGLSLGASEYPR